LHEHKVEKHKTTVQIFLTRNHQLRWMTFTFIVLKINLLMSSSTELALDCGPLQCMRLCLNGKGDGEGVGTGEGNSFIGDKHFPP